ncbi:serine/threonine-protein kinase [Polyangium spumosum]|uniref:Protein kinase n=1 Tax=Polyangium spumosum TaxID=889282 RepID=A0A6N7PUV5_9BACT|nr:serine/threonine-protein kinase [Polyangium spumosum]MRG94035.1 protein kinase [Polyangium spumosum]
MSLEAGRVLSTRYRLVRPLGQGSQGAVWIADHLALNTEVAVKLIDPDLAKREDALERFKREATAAAQLRSAHVVQILDHGIDEGQPFIVMELLDGEDLFERLNKRGRLSLRETSKVITQVCRALARAHAAGIVHRDLKPENVFLCNNEDDEVVKVLDFGVAKVTDPAKATMQRTNVGTLIGTPHYMSPEQVKGISEIDFRTDLWAIGVIAYQCVVGELPFDSEGVGDLLIKISVAEAPVPSKVWKGVPPQFDAWFAKACDKDPNKRFQSARELAENLARVVASVPEAMRGELPPRPISIRPPPVAPASSPGMPAPPSIPKSTKAPALPPRATASPAKPPPRVERAKTEVLDPADVEVLDTGARGPVSEDIDDFEFDFDEEPPVVVSTSPPGVVAKAPAAQTPAPTTKLSSGIHAPPAAPSPQPAAAPAQRVSATPNPFTSDLGAPVLPAGLLDAPAPRASVPAQEPTQAAIPRHPAPITAPGVDSGDRISAPPEIDGARRKRTLTLVALLFVAAAGGIAYMVIRSNMLPPSPVPAASAPPAPEHIEPPPVVEVPSPTASFGATAAPTTKKGPIKSGPTTKKTTAAPNTTTKSAPTATAKQPEPPPDDGTIVIPDPPSDVPPAP